MIRLELWPDLWFLHLRLAFILTLLTLAGFMGQYGWVLDLASHFRLQYVALSATLIGTSLWLRYRRLAAFLVLVLSINVSTVYPYLILKHDQHSQAGIEIKVLLSNVHTSNLKHGEILKLIEIENPDVVILQEVNRAWMKALERLRVIYPSNVASPRGDNFGIAAYSRVQSARTTIAFIGDPEVPSVHLELVKAATRFHVVGTHPVPPVSTEYASLRNKQLSALGAFVRELKGPTILLGDLNATPWSHNFKTLLEVSNLSDTAEVVGLTPSWPMPLYPALIPIDHCLVSKGVAVLDRRSGPNIGSDHLPQIVSLRVPSAGINPHGS